MSQALAIWIGLTAAMGMVTLFAVWSRSATWYRSAAVISFLMAAPVAYSALQQPLGYPDHDPLPPGEYSVLGARIDVDVAIFVMLDDGSGEPRLFRLPYTAGQADKLQQAIDATAANAAGGVEAKADSEGEIEFHPAPQPPSPDKVPEAPVVGAF